MKSLEHKPEHIASLEEIRDTSLYYAAQLREENAKAHDASLSAWLDFRSSTTEQPDGFYVSLKDYRTFLSNFRHAYKLIPWRGIQEVKKLLLSRGKLHSDWILLTDFLDHDIQHLDASELRWFFDCSDSQVMDHGRLLKRHVLFYDDVFAHFKNIADLTALPLEFVAGVSEMEQRNQVPIQNFNPYTLFSHMAEQIKGRFPFDDYEIRNSFDQNLPYNQIAVDIPPWLMLHTNQAMLFSVIYNLSKNAAKANMEANLRDDIDPLDLAYTDQFVPLIRSIITKMEVIDDSLVIQVGDHGRGLSLDQSLQRMHDEFARRLAQDGPEETMTSEWFWNIRRALGEDQAQLLFAWPKNPNALRDITIGSIFDMQFIAGFGPDVWNIQSMTSGMGLWGVRYMTEHLGGSVMGTNKFDGGALFTMVLPKQSVGL